MKSKLLILILTSSLLAACQTTSNHPPQAQSTTEKIQHIWQNLPQTQAEYDAKTADIRRAAQGKTVQQTLYFNSAWEPVAQKDPQGFYRQSYGLQENGLYLMQDFYANGKPQTSLFYGTQPEDADSASARGYLATYTAEGALDSVSYNVSNDFLSNINFCAHEICLRFDQHGTRFDEKVLQQGKTLAVRTFEANVLARYEAFYPNGQTAYLIEAKGFADPKTYRMTQQYYLPNGEKSAGKPNIAAFAQLRRDVLAAELQGHQRKIADTAWQDAEDGYPLLRQLINDMRHDGGY